MPSLLILFIHLGLGGVQRKIVDIVNFLASYKPNLRIYILLRNREDYDLSSEIINKSVKIINYQDKLKIKIPFFFPFFEIYQIWRIKPCSILAFLDFVSIPAIWAKLLFFWRKTRLVLSEDHYASKIVSNFKFGHLRNFLMKVFYPFADVIFVCSQATQKDLVQNYGLPKEKVKIIHNWTTFIERKPKTKKKKYDFLYFGRLEKSKNLGFLLKALRKLRKRKKGISLCLLGAGREEKNLKEMVEKYHLRENVEFVPPTHKVEDFLAGSRIFVYTSNIKAEGFPLAILEAMAIGTPVLTRKFAGAEDFLKDGENCYFFQTEKEFIKKAIWLLNDSKERRKIAIRAREYVKKNHSPQNILAYLKELELL